MSIKLIKTKHLPNFPILLTGKTRRVVTKHFANLPLWLSQDEVAMLNWLLYRISADNTFKYSVSLLNQYSESILKAREEYKSEELDLKTSTSRVRKCLLSLIERGLILNTNKEKYFMLNPLLTYHPDIITRKDYKLIMELYQQGDVNKITEQFGKLVARYLETKKKNYIYGTRK